MTECMFCRIIAGQAPATIVYRDEQSLAFRDAHPIAPVHILVVPVRHIASINDITAEDEQTIGHLFRVARDLAKQGRMTDDGYRLIINTGPDAGQSVFHVHLHLLGGKRMSWSVG
jgi:histidine triad (HIT) family protein